MEKDIPYDSSRSDNIVFEDYKVLKGFVTLKKRGLNFLIGAIITAFAMPKESLISERLDQIKEQKSK